MVPSILKVMDLIIAIILGFIQGVTEFLPVSSSGHVLIFSRIFQNPSSFEFDVLVSFGTLFAVIIYYRKRFLEIFADLLKRKDLNLTLKLTVATIPAVIVGFFFKDLIELYLHGVNTAIFMLLSIGALMIWSARWKPNESLAVNKDLHKITYRHAFIIGLAQCVALISGSSRSGVTMLAALKQGFNTKVAAEWSFLMSVPVIFGASIRVLLSEGGMQFISENTEVFIIANLISFVSGIVAIYVLLKILQNNGLYWFGWYRVGLGVVLILLVAIGVIGN